MFLKKSVLQIEFRATLKKKAWLRPVLAFTNDWHTARGRGLRSNFACQLFLNIAQGRKINFIVNSSVAVAIFVWNVHYMQLS